MSYNQSVNMRGGCPIVFGDRDSQEKYEREVAAAARTQRVRFAVAPRVRLPLPGGKGFIEAGGEVTADMLRSGSLAGQHMLNSALQSGHVIEADAPAGEGSGTDAA